MSKKPLKKRKTPIVELNQVTPATTEDSLWRSFFQRNFIILWVPIFILGTFLRLYILTDQILLDDEWHSVTFIIGRSLLDAFTSINPTDNSSPLLNAYTMLLYNTLGLSETLLRLPVVLVGLVSLIVLPVSIKKLFGARVAVIFSALLAISPFLIFYSRFFRAYILIMFFSFWSLLAFFNWIRSGHRKYAVFVVLLGGIAAYLHPCSSIIVIVPFIFSFSMICNRKRTSRFFNSLGIVVSRRQFFTVFLFTALLTALALYPMFAHLSELPLLKGAISFSGLEDAFFLLCGTSNVPLAVAFFLLLIGGSILIIKRQPLIGLTFASIIPGYFFFFLLVHPFGIGNGVVILRYMIATVPMALLAVAIGLERLCERMESSAFPAFRKRQLFFSLIPFAFVGMLLVFGPIPEIYTKPNNFTNHSAFQGAYSAPNWRYTEQHNVYPGFKLQKEQIPPFYLLPELKDITAIIEYPFDICNHNNLIYFYQHYDKKPRIAGFCSNCSAHDLTVADPSKAESGFSLGLLGLDDFLPSYKKQDRLHFSKVIDITNDAALARNHGAALVIHKTLMALNMIPGKEYFIMVHYNSVRRFVEKFSRTLGPPWYEDDDIVVFKIK